LAGWRRGGGINSTDAKSASMHHLRIQVWGRVQRVGFRSFVQQQATGLGLSGYVRNMADGAVLVEAVGESAQLDKLLGMLQGGPPLAHVSRIDVQEVSPAQRFNGFEVRR